MKSNSTPGILITPRNIVNTKIKYKFGVLIIYVLFLISYIVVVNAGYFLRCYHSQFYETTIKHLSYLILMYICPELKVPSPVLKCFIIWNLYSSSALCVEGCHSRAILCYMWDLCITNKQWGYHWYFQEMCLQIYNSECWTLLKCNTGALFKSIS